MPKILVLYHSLSGNTKKMAEIIGEGAKKEKVDVDVKNVKDVKVEALLNYDGIIIGSPTYYGILSSEIKKFLDESVKFHGQLEGKVGGAFSSSGGIGGGNETTILSIIQTMLVHGMIVQGNSDGCHYGPVSIGYPDERVKKECHEFGSRLAKLVKKLTP